MDLTLRSFAAKYSLRPDDVLSIMHDPKFKPVAIPDGRTCPGNIDDTTASAIRGILRSVDSLTDRSLALQRLRRAATFHQKPAELDDGQAPATNLARSEAYLQLSEAMASLGREDDAIAEARHALHHVTVTWTNFLHSAAGDGADGAGAATASAEARGAQTSADASSERAQSASRAGPALLAQPPEWFERAICVGIEARRVLADRLEVVAEGDPLARATPSRPSPFLAAEEVEKLRTEAEMLSMLFQSEGLADVRKLKAPALLRDPLPWAPGGIPKPPNPYIPPSPFAPMPVQTTQSAASLPRMVRGDIYRYSTSGQRRPRSRQRQRQRATSVVGRLPSDEGPRSNPFEDWRENVACKIEKSLAHIKIKTFEGQNEMYQDLRHKGALFKSLDLKALDALSEDRLYQNRMRYTGYGKLAYENGVKRKALRYQKLHPPTEDQLRASEEERLLFEKYNVKFSKGRTTPSVKDLRMLMHEYLESSPIMKAQRAREAEERRVEEEKRRAEAELERQKVQREKLGGLSLGKQGQTFFTFN